MVDAVKVHLLEEPVEACQEEGTIANSCLVLKSKIKKEFP
jgi:hypothetical protein